MYDNNKISKEINSLKETLIKKLFYIVYYNIKI